MTSSVFDEIDGIDEIEDSLSEKEYIIDREDLRAKSSIFLYRVFTIPETYFHRAMDQITQAVEPLKQFGKDSIRLVKRCTKPDR